MTTLTYHQLTQQITQHYHAQEYAAALACLDQHQAAFPQEAAMLLYTRACLLALLEDTPGALAALRQGLDAGEWYLERGLREDPDLAGLQGLPEFEQIVARSGEALAAAQAAARPQMDVFLPQPGSAAPPLLLALHANNSHLGETSFAWSRAAGRGWLVAVPQSTQVGFPHRYIWNDVERGTADLKAYSAELAAGHAFDPRRCVLGGFSRGGGLAVWLGLSGALPVSGVFAFGPYLPKAEAVRPFLDGAKARGLRVYFLVGDQDDCLEITRELHAIVSAAGIPAHLELIPGLEHVYPDDFGNLLGRGLDFLTG